MAKIFLTGATGYVGGDVLFQLVNSSKQHEIACLVRSAEKASLVSSAFPNVRIVQGDLDNADIIEQEASKADIVLNLAATKHEASCRAIIKGILASQRSRPGYWIQIGGASLFSVPDIKNATYGKAGGHVYDDKADVDSIISLIRETAGQTVNNLILDQDQSRVRAATLIGPLIYGEGRGPCNTRSIQGPDIAKYTLKAGNGCQIGDGESVWSNVHVNDLASLFELLVEAALEGKDGLWNEQGIYLPENGSMSFGELSASIAEEAHRHGLIKSSQVERIEIEDADKVTGHAAILLATNAKLRASRARESLGWQPLGPSLKETLKDMVSIEARSLGIPQ